MANVNLISEAAAKEIAASYFENSSVQSLYVTRDGQVFYPKSKHYMNMHERNAKLQPSWFFEKGKNVKIIEDVKKEINNMGDDTPVTLKALKKHFQLLTDKGDIKQEEWEGLKFAQLRELYEKFKK